MRVEGKDDDNIVLTGEGGRRLEIDDTGGRRPVVLYEAPGTNGYIAEGNLRDPTRRAQWAREIAGPSLDLQNGVKADLNQAATEWHKKLRTPSSKQPSAAVLADEADASLSESGVVYCTRDGEQAFWLERET